MIEEQCRDHKESLEHKLQELNSKVEALANGFLVAEVHDWLTVRSKQVANVES